MDHEEHEEARSFLNRIESGDFFITIDFPLMVTGHG